MKIVLENDVIENLYNFLAKGRGDLDKMLVKIQNGVLQLVATNGQILGVYERKLGANEKCKDCSFLLPLQEFGKVSLFKKHTLVLKSEDSSSGTLSIGTCHFDFELEKGRYPAWEDVLIKDCKILDEYRIFSPDYLKLVQLFVPTVYTSERPSVAKQGYGPAMWTEETNMYKKIVVLIPMKKI